ncbi:MAG: chloride channel protein [Hyphomonadaceae bacterium]
MIDRSAMNTGAEGGLAASLKRAAGRLKKFWSDADATPTAKDWRRRLATLAGAVLLGAAALGFAALGDWAQRQFAQLTRALPYAPLLLTPAVFAAVVFLTQRFVPEARGSGIPQVMAAARVHTEAATSALCSLKTAAAKAVLTISILLAGGAVGREGPTVQLSAAIMVAVHRLLRVPITAGVLIAGGAAGVAAAFNTPLAGVAFAIEELAAAYEQRVAVLVMGAVMIAGFVSLGVAGDYVYFGVMHNRLSLQQSMLAAPIIGVVGGLLGGAFSKTLLWYSNATEGLPARLRKRPILLALACGLVVAVLGVATGMTWGTGYEPTRALVEGQGGPLFFGPAKFIATVATALSGAPGGIFAPSLAVGAGLGNLMMPLFAGAPPGAIAVLAMAAYFVGVVRAPLTAVIILSETTASHGVILPLFATALIADATARLVSRERLYHGLSKGFTPQVTG